MGTARELLWWHWDGFRVDNKRNQTLRNRLQRWGGKRGKSGASEDEKERTEKGTNARQNAAGFNDSPQFWVLQLHPHVKPEPSLQFLLLLVTEDIRSLKANI